MIPNTRAQIAALSDAEALSAFKPAVDLFGAPGCPLTPIPEAFIQPPEVQTAFGALRSGLDAAHPSDSKLVLDERKAKRKTFNEAMERFVDLVQVGSQKQPDLLVRFSLDFLFRMKSTSGTKVAQYRVPNLILQVNDKQPSVVQGKVRGVKKAVEIFHAYDDPTNEANWKHFDSYASGTFTMTGLPSGRRTYVRARFIIGKDKKSPWSDMVSIMVP
ncbi:MAG TPA: hypothetical protein VJ550_08540 [Geomonas sp.]|nr:hypothetical protein [Geomonas sp.]